VAGYADTGRQTVTKTGEAGEAGDTVSFILRSDNPDGTVQNYQGTDTVTGGKIVAATITQTSQTPEADDQVGSRRGRPGSRRGRPLGNARWSRLGRAA
jgi:hypothetical protein